MKNILSLLFYSVITNLCIGQSFTTEGVFSGGDFISNSYAQISWTLGDIQTATLKDKGNTIIITPGLLQSQFNIVGIDEISEYQNLEVKVFPNPVQDILNLSYTSNKKLDLQYKLFNMEGKEILNNNLNGLKTATIQFSNLNCGYYILKISTSDNKFYKSYKILYQN